MCYQAVDSDDTTNAIAFILVVSFAKTMAYSIVSVFIFLFFPIDQYSFLYGLANFPTLITFWLSDPLYSIILGDAEDGSEVTFVLKEKLIQDQNYFAFSKVFISTQKYLHLTP